MTTTLNCLGWMLNQDEQDPCTNAQEIGRLCSLQYAVSATNFRESNYVPNGTTTNGCTCSWSIYNLLSACSYCVGQYQYISWSAWIVDCGSYASNNSYLPSGLSLSQGIPFWAATNPLAWENAVFNITQAANIAEQDKSDVTGGLLSTSTTMTSSPSGASTGTIVGGVLGGVTIIIIGGLLTFWAVRRRRRRRIHTAFAGASQAATVRSTWSRPLVQPAALTGFARMPSAPAFPYSTSFIHSTSDPAPTSLATSPAFPTSGYQPIADAADMITPFLATSFMHHVNQANMSPPASKAARALSERVVAPPRQRARLNPPSYSASVGLGPPGEITPWSRSPLPKTREKWEGSTSGVATRSRRSKTSTGASVAATHTSSWTEQGLGGATTSGTGTVQNMESSTGVGGLGSAGGGDSAETTSDRGVGVSDQRPPAV